MAICKYCGEEISWQNTPNGYKAVDLEPEFVIECRGGDVFLDDEGEEVRGRLSRPDEVDTQEKKLDTSEYWDLKMLPIISSVTSESYVTTPYSMMALPTRVSSGCSAATVAICEQ